MDNEEHKQQQEQSPGDPEAELSVRGFTGLLQRILIKKRNIKN